jgi:DNA-binding NtrC family response regulator
VSQLIGATVSEVERELVLQTIIHCNGNRTRAARMLGLSIRTIRNKLREYSAAEETHPRQLTSRAPRTPGAVRRQMI